MTIDCLEVTGGFFGEKQQQFFYNKQQMASIIYSKNGSGKSSISRAFQQAFNEKSKEESENEFGDKIVLSR